MLHLGLLYSYLIIGTSIRPQLNMILASALGPLRRGTAMFKADGVWLSDFLGLIRFSA